MAGCGSPEGGDSRAGEVSLPQGGLGEGKTPFSGDFEANRRGGDSKQPRASLAIDRLHLGVCRSKQS